MKTFKQWFNKTSDRDKLYLVLIILTWFIFPEIWLAILCTGFSLSLGLGIVWLLRRI